LACLHDDSPDYNLLFGNLLIAQPSATNEDSLEIAFRTPVRDCRSGGLYPLWSRYVNFNRLEGKDRLGSGLADPKLLNQFAVEWVEGKLLYFFSGTLALRRGVGPFL
jgi:hypothetical protein